MVNCSAVGCANNERSNIEITFHRLPRDTNLSKIWKKKINRTELPKEIFLCSNHFDTEMFDKSHDMKQRLLPESCKSSIRRKLIKGAIPTIFYTSKNLKERDTSKKRIEKKERMEIVSALLASSSSFEEEMFNKSCDTEQQSLPESSKSSIRTFKQSMEEVDSVKVFVDPVERYFQERNLVCTGIQTPVVYTRIASTSTLLLERRNKRSFGCQVNIKVKKVNASSQFPTPIKGVRRFKKGWSRKKSGVLESLAPAQGIVAVVDVSGSEIGKAEN